MTYSPVTSFLREATREEKGVRNILTSPTHERYEQGLAKTGHNFYSYRDEYTKEWNSIYGITPDNYILLDKRLGPSQIPLWLDLDFVLSQNKYSQFQTLMPIARQLQLPLISLEHTLPVPQWDLSKRRKMVSMRGDLNVFISEFSINEWGFSQEDPSVRVIRHGVDTSLFKPDDSVEKKPYVLSVVNDWMQRDWCKLAGQKIFTSLGYINIEKIKVGNKVLTDSGIFYNVVETFERDYYGDIIKIWLDSNKEPICFTPDHHIRVYRDGQEKYIESNRLRIGDYLKFPPITQTEFYQSDEEFAWFIGNLIGDGSISCNGSISISCNLNELNKANLLKKYLEKIVGNASISERHRSKGKNIISVEATSKIFGLWLKDKIGNYSKLKRIPDFIFCGPVSSRVKVLQGLWSCDGSFKNGKSKGSRFVYSTTSIQLASQVSSILHSFGIKCCIRKEKRTTNKSNGKIVPIYRVVSTDKDNVERCRLLIEEGQFNSPYSYTITKVEVESEWNGKVYNCRVESDPSYIVYPGFVAHNCCGFNLWQRVSNGLPVRVVGNTPGLSEPASSIEDLVNEYRNAQVFLNTSLISPVPTVLLEAMSCGCAIVSTDNCMIPEVVEHGYNGFLTNDEKEMRGYLELLLKDEKLRKELGANARTTIINRFTIDNFVNSWNSLFWEIAP